MKKMFSCLAFLSIALFPASVFSQDISLQGECPPHLMDRDVVGADYVPGVDVHGRKVADASVDGEGAKPLAYPLEIPVTQDVLRFLDMEDHIVEDPKAETELAVFKVFEDGRVEYNGQDLSSKVSFKCVEEEQDVVIFPSTLQQAEKEGIDLDFEERQDAAPTDVISEDLPPPLQQ